MRVRVREATSMDCSPRPAHQTTPLPQILTDSVRDLTLNVGTEPYQSSTEPHAVFSNQNEVHSDDLCYTSYTSQKIDQETENPKPSAKKRTESGRKNNPTQDMQPRPEKLQRWPGRKHCISSRPALSNASNPGTWHRGTAPQPRGGPEQDGGIAIQDTGLTTMPGRAQQQQQQPATHRTRGLRGSSLNYR